MTMCVLISLASSWCRLLLAVDPQSFYLEVSTSTNTFGLLLSVLVLRIRLISKQVDLMLIDL
jgi:hypothetical protein